MARPSQIDPREREVVLKLKAERIKRGISATKLAAKVNISRTTITNLDSDDARPTLWVLLKICDGLQLELSDVLRE